MKKYECIIQISYEIEADSEAEAKEIAEDLFYEDTNVEICGIKVNKVD